MIFGRRDRHEPRAVTRWRLGLLLVASVVWMAGAILDNDLVTGAAIILLLAAFVLGLARRDPGPE